jgi:UDP-glucose 4-epimerase
MPSAFVGIKQLVDGAESDAFNLGNGNGFSVQQVIEIARHVTRTDIPVRYGPRRPGDPARWVADSARAKRMLQWNPQFDELAIIIAHAWNWERKIANRQVNSVSSVNAFRKKR